MTGVTVQGSAVQKVFIRWPVSSDARFSKSDFAYGIFGGYVTLRKRFLRIIRFCP